MANEKQGESSIPSDVIERLKKEKKQSEDRYFMQGYSDGKKNIQKMSYDELRGVATNYETHQSGAISPDLYDPGIVYCSCFGDEDSWLWKIIDQKQEDENSFDVDNYLRGWVKAIVEFWKEVKGELNIDEDESE